VLHRTFVGLERPQFTIIWYQKGAAFLETLDDRLGRAAFDAAIAQYEQRHPFRWVDDVEFESAFPERPDLQIDNWIYGSGLPSNVSPKPASSIAARVTAQASAFRAGTRAALLDTSGWSDVEQRYFLQSIQDITVPRMGELDAAFGFSRMNTPPLFWLIASAKSLDAGSQGLLTRYLDRGTRASLPVWSTLAQTAMGRTWALNEFAYARGWYDAETAKTIATLLHV